MQKKLLAVALAGAFGAPAVALAQSSTVQVFGTMYLEYTVRADQADATPAAGSQRSNADFLQTPGSEIGFKGEEKLGGGLSAWFQCTSTADIRGDSGNGWCQRNSAIGLKGGFGNVFVGVWDTPFKRTISPTVVGGNDTGIWGTAFLLTGDSTTDTVGANRLNFKRRQRDLITYDSPVFGGFQAMAAFSSSQPSTATLASASSAKPRVLSLGAQYSAGPLYVSAGYEQHRDFGVAGTAAITPNEPKDNAWHVGAAYTWGPVRFGGQYTRQKFDLSTAAGGAGADVRVSAWHAGVDWNIVGPHGLRAAFTRAQDVKGPSIVAVPGLATAGLAAAGFANALAIGNASGAGYRPAPGGDTGADLWQIRYVYTFSKRTEFNVGYVRLNNDNNAGYRLGGLNTPIRAGANEDAWALSMRHTF